MRKLSPAARQTLRNMVNEADPWAAKVINALLDDAELDSKAILSQKEINQKLEAEIKICEANLKKMGEELEKGEVIPISSHKIKIKELEGDISELNRVLELYDNAFKAGRGIYKENK